MFREMVSVAVLTFASVTSAAAAEMVSYALGASEFNAKFCAASRDMEHIFILPGAVFDAQKSITCSDGASILRVSEPADDPGHKVFNIDPPHGSKRGLDCDGKADIGMEIIAINCIPATMETGAHKKS